MQPQHPIVVLTVAGSDSGGGAGIQADLKTFAANGVFGTCAITCITAQNSQGVCAIQTLQPEIIARQMECIFDDMKVSAAKTGMLSTPEIVSQVAESFRKAEQKNLVVDPVMIAKSGDALLEPAAKQALVRELLPLSVLVTPNTPEATELTGKPIHERSDMEEAAERILDLGPNAVLIKGGHLDGPEVADLLWEQGSGPHWFVSQRINTPHSHGTGCTLSAAITARLALGDDLATAIQRGRHYLVRGLRSPLIPGQGLGHPDHFHASRQG